jgi:hypothetical protein
MEVNWNKSARKNPPEKAFGISERLVVFTNFGLLGLAHYNVNKDRWEFVSPVRQNEEVIAWLDGLKWE